MRRSRAGGCDNLGSGGGGGADGPWRRADPSPQGADAVFMDTRDVLVVSPTSDGTSVDLDEAASNAKLDSWFNAHGRHKIVIATGFIAKNKE